LLFGFAPGVLAIQSIIEPSGLKKKLGVP
jgi:hypothetical protein